MSIIPINSDRRGGINGDPFSLDVWDSFDAVRDHIFSSLDMWRPFSDFPLRQAFSDIPLRPEFSEHWGGFFAGADFAPVNTRIDWKETRVAHVFRGYFPGLGPDDVVIEVGADRSLKISGGSFSSSFQLPENARLELVSASMSGGHLRVDIPKEEEDAGRPSSLRVVEIEG